MPTDFMGRRLSLKERLEHYSLLPEGAPSSSRTIDSWRSDVSRGTSPADRYRSSLGIRSIEVVCNRYFALVGPVAVFPFANQFWYDTLSSIRQYLVLLSILRARSVVAFCGGLLDFKVMVMHWSLRCLFQALLPMCFT